MMTPDERWMQLAYQEAERAFEEGEVPVGAVIVCENQIIARGRNQIELLKDPTAHAEMIAITAAAGSLGTKWLENCDIYVTLEPCCMCSGALVLSRIRRLVFGANDPKAGAVGSLYNLAQDARLNHRIEVSSGILESKCSAILKEFFVRLRNQARNN